MSRKLNPEQAYAVNIKDTNTLVFASAGAGKTTVLVERLKKRILEDRISLDQIIAMTFTEAAATNIKKRLEKELRDLLKENDDPFLSKQLSLLPNAHISTIHSFCLSIINEYYYLIGLNKNLTTNILNEAAKNKYLHMAFIEALKSFDNIKTLNQMITSSLFSFDSLEEAILSIISKANSSSSPLVWLDSIKSKPISKLSDLDDYIIDKYLKTIYDNIDLAITYLNNLIDYCENLEERKYYEFYKTTHSVITKLRSIDDYDLLISELAINPLKTMLRPKDPEFKVLLERYKGVLKVLANNLIPSKELIRIHNLSLPFEHLLIDIAKQTLINYQNIKLENETIDFDDFEHYCLAILEVEDGLIANKLRQQYHEIMIDEFQDTSNIQYLIASSISNNNLFLVGDIKQSIYRFRGALPKIMQSLKENDHFEVINIKNNYRSKARLINFNNYLFERLMNIYHDDFIESDLQIPGIDAQYQDNVDIYFYNVLVENLNDKEAKAKFIANDILRKHNEGVAFKDIAILSRSHNDKKLVKKALDELNIPCFIEENYSYFNSKSISLICSFLRLCIDPSDKIAKVAILSSEMFKLSDNDLLKLKEDHFDYPLLNEHLKNLTKLYKTNNLVEILSYILNINDYYDELIDLYERSNIDLLLVEIANIGFKDASSLLYYIEENKDKLKGGASVISSEADVVKMMTIHKSKGLEFDTVYLYSQTNNPFNETKDPVIVDDEIGIGIKYVDYEKLEKYSTIKRLAIKEKNNIDDILEYNRLLYVATTRAKRQLIIVDSIKEFVELPLDKNLLNARKGFSNLIYNIAKDYNGMHLLTVSNIIEESSLKISTSKKTEFTKRNFNVTNSESISPSDLKKRSLELNLKLKDATGYGTRLHYLFECIDYKKEYDIKMLKDIDNTFSDDIYQKILNFLNSDLILKAKKMNIYQEYSYYYKDDHNYYHGYIDFLAVNESEAIIIDYKSDHLEDEVEFIKLYRSQLEAYQKLIEDSLSLKVESYIYSIYLDRFIRI